MKFNIKVVEGCWDEVKGIWNFIFEDQVIKEIWQDWVYCFVNGIGIFNSWKWFDILGFYDFKGEKMYSVKWNFDIDFKGKIVVVIGIGLISV